MPARTNEFQQLIAVLQGRLDPGTVVTEPAMVKDRFTGTLREVDVIVSGSAAGQPVIVAIECRDRGRAADVTWVDEMHTKHSRLETDILVLASRSGFTAEATRIAGLYGIRLTVLDDVDSTSAERLFPDVRSLWGKTWEMTIQRVSISVEATQDLPAERVQAAPDTALFFEDGTELGQASELANGLARCEPLVNQMQRDAAPEHKFIVFGMEPPVIQGRRVCLQKIEPLTFRRIETFRVVAECRVTVAEFPLRHGRYGAVRVAWGTGDMLGRSAMIVATETSEQKGQLSVHFVERPPPGCWLTSR